MSKTQTRKKSTTTGAATKTPTKRGRKPAATPTETVKKTTTGKSQNQTDMNDALYKVYKTARKVITDESKYIINSRHKLGLIVSDIYNGEDNVYGANAIPKLSAALDINVNILYKARKFADLYDKESVAELVKARDVNDKPLMWGHIEQLITVEKDKDRQKFLDMALSEGLSPESLSKKIQESFGGPRSNSTGRPLAQPKNFEGYLDSIISTIKSVIKKSDQIWLGGDKSLYEAASELEVFSASQVDMLKTTMEQVGEASERVSDLMQELTIIHNELLATIEKSGGDGDVSEKETSMKKNVEEETKPVAEEIAVEEEYEDEDDDEYEEEYEDEDEEEYEDDDDVVADDDDDEEDDWDEAEDDDDDDWEDDWEDEDE